MGCQLSRGTACSCKLLFAPVRCSPATTSFIAPSGMQVLPWTEQHEGKRRPVQASSSAANHLLTEVSACLHKARTSQDAKKAPRQFARLTVWDRLDDAAASRVLQACVSDFQWNALARAQQCACAVYCSVVTSAEQAAALVPWTDINCAVHEPITGNSDAMSKFWRSAKNRSRRERGIRIAHYLVSRCSCLCDTSARHVASPPQSAGEGAPMAVWSVEC